MKLSIGIVGLPNVGKSTLFKAITNQEITVANYPFATIDPNVGIVPVPDERIQKLTEMSKSKKTIPAAVEFYDIAGLVRGANKGEGLGNQFLANIRECKAIIHVVRCFQNSEIIHVEGDTHPIRDIEIIESELALKDLDTVEKRMAKFETEARGGDKNALKNLEILKQIKSKLEKGELVFEFADEDIMKEIQLLSSKKQLFLLNGSEADVTEEIKKKIEELKGSYVVADLSESAHLPELIQKAYAILDLISFFTTGEDETRSWTIRNGAKAPEAAGAIHTDFEKKFIRAEVVSYEDFVLSGGWNQSKQKGKLRLEGKEYLVKDGDIMEIRHG